MPRQDSDTRVDHGGRADARGGRLRIGLVTEDLFRGGAERVVGDLAVGLARRGHAVCVYCVREAGEPRRVLAAAGVTVRDRSEIGGKRLLAWRLGGWFRKDGVEIAHAHNSAAVLGALPGARLLGIPLVQTRHGALLGRASRPRTWADRLAPWLDRVVIVAESLRAGLPRRVAARAVWIPNGIERGRVEPAAARTRLAAVCGRALAGPVVLSVGTVCAEKDTCGLLAAFARLRAAWPDATLVCVGRERGAQYAARVRATVVRLGLAPHVIFTGPWADAWRLMAGADVFCLSSATEALPVVVAEAMGQRVPIVATAVGDVGRLDGGAARGATLIRDGENGLLVPAGDPEALAGALARVLRDPAAARRRARVAASDFERDYTAETMVARHEALYRACLDRRTPTERATRRARILMVGPPADRLGGMTSVIDGLMAGPLGARCELRRFAQTESVGVEAWWRAVWRHGRALGQLGRVIRRERIELVHLHTCSFMSFYRSLTDLALVRLLGRRAVLHIHGGRFEEFCAGAGWLGRATIRWGARWADAVIVLSPAWRARLARYLGDARVVAIPNGVAGRTLVPRANAVCRFVYVGALLAAKGMGELIGAARRLRERGVAFTVDVVGPVDSADARVWRRDVAQWGLEDCVRLVGPVRGAAKDAVYAAADCLVLPSHQEGLPMVVLEAGAAGLAVIATEVGALPELLAARGGGFAWPGSATIAPLVPVRDVEALAEAMGRMAREADLRCACAAALHARVRSEYSRTRVAGGLHALYARVLRRRDARSGSEWLVGHLVYPLHEWLRGRPTLRVMQALQKTMPRGRDSVSAGVCERVRDLLAFARARLPYYAERCAESGVDPQGVDPAAELRKLTPMAKADVRTHGGRMLWREVPGRPIPCSSGGTTGDTLHFFVDRVRQAEDLGARLFMQQQFGVEPGARRLYLWGSPIERKGPPVKRWRDRLINEVLLNAFEMSAEQMDRHLARMMRFRPRVIYGYPTAVALLARHARRRYGPRDFAWLRLAVLTGEEITEEQRAQVRAVFGCAVASEYGNREVGLIAHECPRGGLHVLAPHVYVEILKGDQPAAEGELGEIVCTTLNTRAQPLIRYRLRDAGRLLPNACECGLPLPLMELVGGKITGFIALPDGRLCHGAVSSYTLREERGIVEFRTHQKRLDYIEVSLVVNDRFDPQAIERIRGRYARLFGDQVQVECRVVDRIPPDPSGKRRHVVSDVAPDYFQMWGEGVGVNGR